MQTQIAPAPWDAKYISQDLPMELSAEGDAYRWLDAANGLLGIVDFQFPKPGNTEYFLIWLDPNTGIWTRTGKTVQDAYTRGLDALRRNAWARYLQDEKKDALTAALKWHKGGKTEARQAQAVAWMRQCVHARESAGDPIPCALSPTGGIVHIREIDLDARGPYLGASNGVIDLDAGALLAPMDGARQYITRSIGYAFDAGATDPLAEKLLHHPTQEGELQEFIPKAMAWALRGDPRQRFYLMFDEGNGGSGKTVLIKAVVAALGEYGEGVDMDALVGRRGGSAGRATPELAPLANARIGLVEEANNRGMDQERFKALTGGGDVKFRNLYENPQQRPVTCTLFATGNGALQIDLAEGAARRRYTPALYNEIPEELRDARLLTAFEPSKDADGIRRNALLAHLVRLGACMQEPPALPPEVKAKIAEHAAASRGDEGAWLDANLLLVNEDGAMLGAHNRVSSGALYAEFTKANPNSKMPQASLTKMANLKMADAGLPTAKRMRIDGKVAMGWAHARLLGAEAQEGL